MDTFSNSNIKGNNGDIDLISKLGLPNEVLDEYMSLVEYSELPKNYVLLKQEKLYDKVWLLLNGAVRYYYTSDDGNEHNTWFAFENDIICDFNSLIFNKPSSSNIKLIEDSILISITYEQIQLLLEKYHSYNKDIKDLLDFAKDRNKIFHGQITANGLTRADLLEKVNHIRKWSETLGKKLKAEIGYDGFSDSLKKSTVTLTLNNLDKFDTIDKYKKFIKNNLQR